MKRMLIGLSIVCIMRLAILHVAAVEPTQATWEKFFPGGLINSQGEKVSSRVLEGKMVCLYFSASWCGPCKAVTPKLAALRDQAKGSLEVVLVSQDRSEAEQLKYMREAKMTWP